MNPLPRIFLSRRMAAMLLLGFASGVPALLTSDNLQLWMKGANIDVGRIGLLSLVGLPYVLKFLWAPLMDRFAPRLLGRRRGWLIITQLLLIGAILLMAMGDPARSVWYLATMALVVAFLSASQDIVADAYRADVLAPAERGAGMGVWVGGYRVAMVAVGAGALLLVGKYGLSWGAIYALSAGAMLIGVLATLTAPEPASPGTPPPTLRDAVWHPLQRLLLRPDGALVLAFVILFRLPDALAGAMTLPFMKDIGIREADIGAVRQGLGLGVTILGALVGGGIVARLGLWQSLWVFGALQALSNLGFCLLAWTGPRYDVMVGVVVLENFCAGLVTAGFAAFLMGQCEAGFSATQYALFSGVMQLAKVLGGAPSGYLAQAIGWPGFFALSVALGVPGMLLLWWLGRADSAPPGRSGSIRACPTER